MIPHWISRRVPFRLLQKFGGRTRIRFGGQTAVVPLADSAALDWIYWRETWKTQLIQRVLGSRPGTFVDVGVNVGQTLADFLSTGATAHYLGFEPNVRCLSFLDELVRASGFEHVEFVPVGLSDQSEARQLHFTTDSSNDSTASLRSDLRPCSIRRRQWIWTATFDELLATMPHVAPALIKIDVEGGELEVLRGMTGLLRHNPPPLLCEVLLADPAADRVQYRSRVEALHSLLDQFGYRIFRVVCHPDESIQGLAPIQQFPLTPWTPERAGECDYFFAPPSCALPAPVLS